MSGRKSKQGASESNQKNKDAIEMLLDSILKQALNEHQYEAFYIKSAEELRKADEVSVIHIARMLQNADAKEQAILVHLLKHFRGVDHIRFLQDFIRKEMFLPRIGLLILELFNKADVILEDGLASRLLELDNLTQRIRLAIESSTLNDALVAEFTGREQNERAGIIAQLMDETRDKITDFMLKLLEKDKVAANEALNIFSGSADLSSLRILNTLFERTKRKDIEKSIKKIVHSLKQKGIDAKAPEAKKKKESILKKISLPDTRAFVSGIDPEGFRLIFMIKPVTTFENKIFNILINDSSGLQNIEVVNGLRRECHQFIERLSTDQKIEFLETTPENAAYLVKEACALTSAVGKVLPTTLEQWQATFSDLADDRKHPLIYDFFSSDTIRAAADDTDRVSLLLDDEIVILWFAVSADARENWRKLTNVLYSPIVLSDDQKKERIRGLMIDTAQQFFNAEKRQTFRRRLEEHAWWLYAKGQSEKALASLQAAEIMVDQELRIEQSKLCMGIVQKGFRLYESSSKGAKDTKDSLIADPGEFSLIA